MVLIHTDSPGDRCEGTLPKGIPGKGQQPSWQRPKRSQLPYFLPLPLDLVLLLAHWLALGPWPQTLAVWTFLERGWQKDVLESELSPLQELAHLPQ